MLKQRAITAGLLLAMVLLGIKIAQRALPPPPAPTLTFTCAVALNHALGEVCVHGQPGAAVRITITYCDGSQMQSPALHTQIDGDYRWLWHVSTHCVGTAQARAFAIWQAHIQAEALATFSIGAAPQEVAAYGSLSDAQHSRAAWGGRKWKLLLSSDNKEVCRKNEQ